jgi:hypothetical protein
MEPGFGVNLEGSILRGNLTLEANQSPLTGDGSLELSGTLYADTILPFNNQSQGKSSIISRWICPYPIYNAQY